MAKQDKTVEVEQNEKPKFNFKVVKNVTLPLLKLQIDEPVHVKITSEMFVGKDVKPADGDKKKDPAILSHIINLETGEPMQMIMNSVICANLKDVYPDASYVGKSFQFIKHDKRTGKQYHDFSITEIEV